MLLLYLKLYFSFTDSNAKFIFVPVFLSFTLYLYLLSYINPTLAASHKMVLVVSIWPKNQHLHLNFEILFQQQVFLSLSLNECFLDSDESWHFVELSISPNFQFNIQNTLTPNSLIIMCVVCPVFVCVFVLVNLTVFLCLCHCLCLCSLNRLVGVNCVIIFIDSAQRI